MRAAAQNRDVAMLMGINPNRVFCVALGIALALAGAAGSLLMPFYSAYPFVGQVFTLMAFVAVVMGSLGNVIGALIASLLMGVAESLGIQYVGADIRTDRGGRFTAAGRLPSNRPGSGEKRDDDARQSTRAASSCSQSASRFSSPCRWSSEVRLRSTSSSASCLSPLSASPGT